MIDMRLLYQNSMRAGEKFAIIIGPFLGICGTTRWDAERRNKRMESKETANRSGKDEETK